MWLLNFLFGLLFICHQAYSNDTLSIQEQQFITHVQQCIAQAETCTSKITPAILNIQGMSSPKVRHFLNNLCAMKNTHYLEIGCWQGSTWIAALYKNQGSISSAIAIDNWSEFGGPKEAFARNCVAFLQHIPYRFISKDCFKVDLHIFKQPINIYFYDGEHSALSQEKAFTYFNAIFADLFIAVVDDWNWDAVTHGTHAAFHKLRYEVLFETALPAHGNGDVKNWWNGLYVAVIRKPQP